MSGGAWARLGGKECRPSTAQGREDRDPREDDGGLGETRVIRSQIADREGERESRLTSTACGVVPHPLVVVQCSPVQSSLLALDFALFISTIYIVLYCT